MVQVKKPPAKGGHSKRPGKSLEPVTVFQPNAPILHVNDDIRVVTINGESKGLVRKIGAGMFLWSNPEGEGRVDTEEEAFLKIGFLMYWNNRGKRCLRKVDGTIVTELDL